MRPITFFSHGVRLAGVLRVPEGPGPFPAVVMCAGMTLTRDVWLQPNAEWLCARGFVTRPFIASGRASQGRARPINLSGGLVSKGHPLAASGLAMVHELVTQLRGEAGSRQSKSPRLALWQNAGGLTGFDEAACAVGLLERASTP